MYSGHLNTSHDLAWYAEFEIWTTVLQDRKPATNSATLTFKMLKHDKAGFTVLHTLYGCWIQLYLDRDSKIIFIFQM
jgi:hypothetical protein